MTITAAPVAPSTQKPAAPWRAAISIRDRGKGFETLPAPSALLGQRSDVSLGAVNLPAALETLAGRDPWPIPLLANREGYYIERDLDSWKTGLLDYHLVRARAATRGVTLRPGDRVLDLGCASGRALRHFVRQFPHDAGGTARPLGRGHQRGACAMDP